MRVRGTYWVMHMKTQQKSPGQQGWLGSHEPPAWLHEDTQAQVDSLHTVPEVQAGLQHETCSHWR